MGFWSRLAELIAACGRLSGHNTADLNGQIPIKPTTDDGSPAKAPAQRYRCYVSKEPDCLWYVHFYEPPDGRTVDLIGPYDTKEDAEWAGNHNWRAHEYR